MGSTDKYDEVALLLRGTIKKKYRESNSLPWPPIADDLVMSLDDLLPSNLMRFLTLMISGDADLEKSEKTRRLVLSISQVWQLSTLVYFFVFQFCICFIFCTLLLLEQFNANYFLYYFRTSAVLWQRESGSCLSISSSVPLYVTFIAVNYWLLFLVG